MSYLTLRSSYIYFTLHSITFISYIWPFGDSHYADVALGENEFDTPGIWYRHCSGKCVSNSIIMLL